MGTWDVNLRIRQDDHRWQDSVRAEARIYPVLRGKAVLELWDSASIKGFSLRYYDVADARWKLWLNWPSANRSGTSSLDGGFRHGRGEFFSVSPRADGGRTISRYTFSDITADSLRWDDAFSGDDGRTWTNNWIMEFDRTAHLPVLPARGGDAHTYDGGGRCDDPAYRAFDPLVGRFTGELGVLDAAGEEHVLPATWTGHRVLGGCAVLGVLQARSPAGAFEVFQHFTVDSASGLLEVLSLDSTPSTGVVIAVGPAPEGAPDDAADGAADDEAAGAAPPGGLELETITGEAAQGFDYRFGPDGLEVSARGGGWRASLRRDA